VYLNTRTYVPADHSQPDFVYNHINFSKPCDVLQHDAAIEPVEEHLCVYGFPDEAPSPPLLQMGKRIAK